MISKDLMLLSDIISEIEKNIDCVYSHSTDYKRYQFISFEMGDMSYLLDWDETLIDREIKLKYSYGNQEVLIHECSFVPFTKKWKYIRNIFKRLSKISKNRREIDRIIKNKHVEKQKNYLISCITNKEE